MGTIATLAERAMAKAGSAIDRVVPSNPDKAERLGEKIKGIVGQKIFDKIESFADAADEERYNRRIQKEKDPVVRAGMISAALGQSPRQFTRDDRSGGRGL
ncbi:hypothetical protein MESS2_p110009 [Mesorhizobium metallidurans STM 2683]|uniref:Uncharacterized protein n=1 Tax=Mesorhizobium metallidurans STM 2683 TaxID=1297569 RepID=M5EZS2_9HYPH|nr:hypothetical protein [Mesorhizobium metallidurans]CCV09410.1 hypothetical protein MESS2_p110009 [Mesorhizobium metallidurans STM 2683]